MTNLVNFLDQTDAFMWSYLATPIILLSGAYFSLKFKFPQLNLKDIFGNFYQLLTKKNTGPGVHPIFAFFTSIGGCIGVGNLVAVCTAIKIGGPGALFWIWIAGFLGMLLKYSEVYLGIEYRRPNNQGGFDGGPMYYLQKAFKSKVWAYAFALLLALYGTEVLIFNIVANTASQNLNIHPQICIITLLVLVMFAVLGGINRIGKICSVIIPSFVLLFIVMSMYVLFINAHMILPVIKLVFTSAFTGHAAIGGFTGSSILLTISQGIARGCYTGDIGVGYAAVIHAETATREKSKQAKLAIFGIIIDTFIVVSLSILLILVTDVWYLDIPANLLVQSAFEPYFPYMPVFMSIFLFMVGYSTIIAFFFVGVKSMRFILGDLGVKLYYIYAIIMFYFFSLVKIELALILMSLSGASLLLINSAGIFRLRNKIRYDE